MRIIVVGPVFPDSFARNVVVTLAEMGHEVHSISGTRTRHQQNPWLRGAWELAQKAFPAIEESGHKAMVRQAKELAPDLVLVTCKVVPPPVVAAIKATCSARVVCWYTDPITGSQRHYLAASPYDALFLKEPYLVHILREKLGLNTHLLHECCNPRWHRRVELFEPDRARYATQLAAFGSLHYYRARMLEPFSASDLKIWGAYSPSWIVSPSKQRYMNHFVAEEEKAKAIQAAQVVLNTMGYWEIEGLNCTLFETAGCGGFQIADWKPTMAECFEPEREIVTFRTAQELKEKVAYYLAKPDERQAIADRAYARAHREHTYEHRLREMFRVLGLRAFTAEAAEGAEKNNKKHKAADQRG
jgi:spore maturation protein CgeB